MNDSRHFIDAESVRSGLSHVPSQPALLPPFRDPGGMLSRSVGMPSRNDGPPSIWDTHGIAGNVFCKSNGVFFITLSTRTRIQSDRQPEIHSTLVREDFQRIWGRPTKTADFGTSLVGR